MMWRPLSAGMSVQLDAGVRALQVVGVGSDVKQDVGALLQHLMLADLQWHSKARPNSSDPPVTSAFKLFHLQPQTPLNSDI